MQLTPQLIRLNARANSKQEAIAQVAQLLANNGKTTPAYEQSMLAREAQENTYLGNGVAIPHGIPENRHFIHETAIAIVQFPQGVDWEDGELAYLVVGIAAKDNEHLGILKRLSTVVSEEKTAKRLAQTDDIQDILSTLSAVATSADAYSAHREDNSSSHKTQKDLIIGVTACPTGVAHTYMAQEALEKGAEALGYAVKIETQGSVGARNVLHDEEIAQAAVVIIAADTNVDAQRFAGKKLYRTTTKAAIANAQAVIEKAFAEGTPHQAEHSTSTSANKQKTGVYKHLMTGVSHMLPFVVAGGLLIALGFALGSFLLGAEGIHIYKEEYRQTLAATLFWIGKDAFALFVPILGAYIGYSIAGRTALAPAMVGAYIAANTGAGFLGAILAGFIAGYWVAWLSKIIKLPKELESLKPMIILPLLGTTVVGLLMYYLIGEPIAFIQSGLEDWLKNMQGTNALLLGAILGAMMAIDMGGPINKAAYLFSTALIASDVFAPMAATMAAGMTPPLAIALATLLVHNRFSEEERQAGKATGILGLSFITEGAIPFAAKDPLRVIPALMIGSALAGALSMWFECGLRAPHGGIFVLFIPNAVINLGGYALAIALGTGASTLALALFKKPVA
ncbi:fructose-specific PTS transporter subunit EIIC [Rappaport israeli]|uniref:fructose-specific PTS transporter subunit EIIC n=1 Tax=Rappaport israeli TaxID=1839807 RepID=UPI0009313EFB|nr:fructose-specific PTS transporter subunit EIIC [Rappaport israeli]